MNRPWYILAFSVTFEGRTVDAGGDTISIAIVGIAASEVASEGEDRAAFAIAVEAGMRGPPGLNVRGSSPDVASGAEADCVDIRMIGPPGLKDSGSVSEVSDVTCGMLDVVASSIGEGVIMAAVAAARDDCIAAMCEARELAKGTSGTREA